MTLEWPKNVIEEMTEVLLSLLYIIIIKYLVSFKQSGIFKYIEHKNIYFSQNVRGINDKSSKLATHTIRKL